MFCIYFYFISFFCKYSTIFNNYTIIIICINIFF